MGVYWASHEQRDKNLEYRDVVFMDCTAKKSNLLWPVCLAVGVNEENKSVILGQAILMSEAHNFRCDWHFLKDIVKKYQARDWGTMQRRGFLIYFRQWIDNVCGRF